MVPVRWKLFIAVTVLCVTQKVVYGDLVNKISSMTSDGWRPIIGTSQRDAPDEITLYKNPMQEDNDHEPIKAQQIFSYTLLPTASTKPYQTITASTTSVSSTLNSNIIQTGNNKPQGGKVSSIKQKPFLLLPAMPVHPPHIPVVTSGHRGIPSRHQLMLQTHGKKHIKPMRTPLIAHSSKHEVYLPPPSGAIGVYGFYNVPHMVGKTRETHGIKYLPFGHGRPHNNDELNNHFNFPSDAVLQQIPIQSYVIQNDANIFVNHQDEYTRNLVPPPYKPTQENTTKKHQISKPDDEGQNTEVATSINNPQLVVGRPRDRAVIPENIIVQLPPSVQPGQFVQSNQLKFGDKEPADVQVTKEKLKVFHNTIPPSNHNTDDEKYEKQFYYQTVNKPNVKSPYQSKPNIAFAIFEEPQQEVIKKPVSEVPKLPTYEVTENQQWQPHVATKPSTLYSSSPSIRRQPHPSRIRPPQAEEIEITFLPTPYLIPDHSVSTSPTQVEISSIYAELNQKNQNNFEYSTYNPEFFSVKEVSTHYPILASSITPTQLATENTENNEITTKNKQPSLQIYQIEEETQPSPPLPTLENPRPHQRRRKPVHQSSRTTTTSTTTTTAAPAVFFYGYEDIPKVHVSQEDYSGETQRPQRRRKVTRTTTTTPTPQTTESEHTHKQRNRHKYDGLRIRPTLTTSAESSEVTTETIPPNHKMPEVQIIHNAGPQATENIISTTTTDNVITENYPKIIKSPIQLLTTTEEPQTKPRKRIRPTTSTTTESTINDIEYYSTYKNTITSPKQGADEAQEIEESTIAATTVSATTTSTTEHTTKANRIRGRPNKYDNKNRPRFSVKEYRQRLSQYSTTTTTESIPKTTTENVKPKFPQRSRKPILPISDEDETTDRPKFSPKDPRYGLNHDTDRKVNTRVRPQFGRQRSTTEVTSTTSKVSIKPNVLTNLRRPPSIGLRNKIFNKMTNKTNVAEKTTTKSSEFPENRPEVLETTLVSVPDISESFDSKKVETVENTNNDVEIEKKVDEVFATEDPFLHAQRVSDLTLSAQKDYDTPGLFKAVLPNSRRVPNYFTISTDDPILPIEAFFPNLKDTKSSKTELT